MIGLTNPEFRSPIRSNSGKNLQTSCEHSPSFRDRGTYKFALPESMIERTVKENIEGVSAIYEHVLAKSGGQKTTSTVKTTKTTTQTTTSISKETAEANEIEDHCPCIGPG